MATVSGLNINGTGYDIDAKTFNGYSTGAFATSGHTHSEYQTTAAMSGYSTTSHTHDNLTRRQSCYSSNTYSTGYFLLAQWKGGSGTGNHDASIAGVFTQGAINYEFKAGARASGATVNSKYNYVNATTDMLVITYEVDTSNNNRIILRVYSKITANWQRSVVYINAVTNADMYTPANINSSDLTLPGTYSTTTIGTVISQTTVVGSHTHDYAAKNGNYSANGLIAASASYSDGVYWSYGTSNLARPVGFAWGDSNLWKDNASFSSSIVYDANFAYNPTTHKLAVSALDIKIPPVYNGAYIVGNGGWAYYTKYSWGDDANTAHNLLPIVLGNGLGATVVKYGLANSQIPEQTDVYMLRLDTQTTNKLDELDNKVNGGGDYWGDQNVYFDKDKLNNKTTHYLTFSGDNKSFTTPLSALDKRRVYEFYIIGSSKYLDTTFKIHNTTKNTVTVYTTHGNNISIAKSGTSEIVRLGSEYGALRTGTHLSLCYYDDSHIMAGYDYC